jgi:hypothetical protein
MHAVTIQASNIYDVLHRQKSFIEIAKRVKSAMRSFGFKGRSSDLQLQDIQEFVVGKPRYAVIRFLDEVGRRMGENTSFTT